MLKGVLLFIAGMIVGAFLLYGYLWYGVLQKFNDVWTCQVFTGKLSLEQSEHCAKLGKQPQ